MKKLLVVLAVLLICGTARAELNIGTDKTLNLLPAVENGWYYDFTQSELINATGCKILAYKGVELDAMWATGVGDEDRTENLVLGSLGYRLGELDQLGIGVTFPLKDIIDLKPSIMVGYNIDRKEIAYGIGCNIVKIKF